MPPPASRSPPRGASSLLWVWREHGGGTLGAATPERMRPQGEASPRRRRTLPKDRPSPMTDSSAHEAQASGFPAPTMLLTNSHPQRLLSASTGPFGSRDRQAGLTVVSGAGTKEGSQRRHKKAAHFISRRPAGRCLGPGREGRARQQTGTVVQTQHGSGRRLWQACAPRRSPTGASRTTSETPTCRRWVTRHFLRSTCSWGT